MKCQAMGISRSRGWLERVVACHDETPVHVIHYDKSLGIWWLPATEEEGVREPRGDSPDSGVAKAAGIQGELAFVYADAADSGGNT